MEVRDITGVVQEAIINLSNYGSNDHHIKLPTALREAQSFLKDLQKRSDNILKANDTIKCANDQTEFWSDELSNTNQQREKLQRYLKLRVDFIDKLKDLKNLTHQAFRDSSETEVFVTKNKKDFERLHAKAKEINLDSEEIEKLLNLGIIAQSDSLMESFHDNTAKLKIENSEIIELNEMVEEMITAREDEFADISESFIPKARIHAEDLSRRSKIIVDLFQHSKDGAKVAMLAGTAHKNIADAITAAREASKQAYDAAIYSNDKLNPIDVEEETMIEKGQDLSLESEAIQSEFFHLTFSHWSFESYEEYNIPNIYPIYFIYDDYLVFFYSFPLRQGDAENQISKIKGLLLSFSVILRVTQRNLHFRFKRNARLSTDCRQEYEQFNSN